MDKPVKKALLVLADGTHFAGIGFGCEGEATGEVVFNTSMQGYQEIFTDPSYAGQIMTLTYPEIGNIGINPEDFESERIHIEGLVVRNYNHAYSNFRATESLGDFLKARKVVGISGLDTRALVRHIRMTGAQPGIISTTNLDLDRLKKRAKELPRMDGMNLVDKVTTASSYEWTEGLWSLGAGYAHDLPTTKRVVAYDYGIKRNILRNLVSAGCAVTVVPASMPAEAVLAMNPDGVFLSNGPGDPVAVTYAVENTAKLIGAVPVFGICLGHQIAGLALGGKTYKLKFGHRGGNHPVKDLTTGKVEITAQNHGFAVDIDSLKGVAELTHLNLNDRTSEGMSVAAKRFFSVQYHPEASPGPHDSHYLFRRFVQLMERG